MNKKLKQILNRYPMLEEDRNYIANLVNGGGSGCNYPIVIDVDDLHYDRTPIPLSRDIAKQIFDGALVILKDGGTWHLVNDITTHSRNFPCNLYLTVITHDDGIFHPVYVYDNNNQQLMIDSGPL